MKLACRQDNAFRQAAVAHDSQSLVMFTAVGKSSAAGVTLLAVQVGLYRAAITGLEVRDSVANFEHFDSQLVAWDPWVRKEWELAQVAAKVSAADTNAMHAD